MPRIARHLRLFVALPGLAILVVSFCRAHPGHEIAVTDLTNLIATAPADAELHVRRALGYIDQRRWSEAEADLDLATTIERDHPSIPLARAELNLARRDYPAAVRTLDPVLRRHPTDPTARILRARAYTLSKDPAAALADFQVALAALAEPKPELWLEANALLATDPLAALTHIEAGLARIGPAPALIERALAYELQLHRSDAALDRLSRLAATSERPDAFLKRRGDLLASLGRINEAHTAYTAALTALAQLPEWLRTNEANRRLIAQLTHLVTLPR